MKTLFVISVMLISLLATMGCSDVDTRTVESQSTAQPAAKAAPAAKSASFTGPVVETMDAGGYTYVRVDKDGDAIWAAAPKCEMAEGTEVFIDMRMPMKNFHSETLDRTFEVVYFTGGFTEADKAQPGNAMGGQMAMGGQTEHPNPTAGGTDVELAGIEKAEGGLTVAEVWGSSKSLAGQQVTVRGKVVKYNSGIMGRNWIHVRDGSGSDGTNDLTVTSQGMANVGDLVTVKGTIAVDRDFGAGYKYAVIMEDADVKKAE